VSGVLRVLVADDESMARKRLRRLVEQSPGVMWLGDCANGTEVLQRVAKGGVDVLLLDIHMPGLSGMEALRLLPADGPLVIFCTAHADHAVEAFDAGAIDYLMKPIEEERLQKALARAREREATKRFRAEVERQRTASPPGAPRLPPRLPLATREGIVLLDPEAISHAILDGELVTVCSDRGKVLTDLSLQELEAKLPDMLRVHRRALLNLRQVARLENQDTGGYVARTLAGEAVPVSRQAARELRKRLGLRKGPDEDDDE
jgi:two-component system LytT family response regulator